ncbi:PAS sensor-containing signal transduction histidine kinase [Aliarcobacter faecis]|uniref:PAS domain S-box protein n=1 Tax=Aliarcobacter faecis TaxID=1564138 RepID=UPI00047EE285|nr:PAS domain S-box protein [Aliarcobacter faecis]QKF73491.1 PAS sensor-containing signal transduction histidine kinase [Aliarcobacter faecis]
MDINYYKEKLEQLQKLSKTGFWELDLKSNKITYSSEIYNILEIDKDTFSHKYEDFLNIVDSKDREAVNNFYLDSLKNIEKEYSFKHKIITKSGKIKYLEQKYEVKFDEKSSPIAFFGTTQDISEQEFYKKKLEEDLKQIKKQQNELEAIFNNTIDGLAIIDLETNFIKVNKTYCEITGLSEKELLNTSCLNLTAPEYLEESKLSFEEFLATNTSKPFEKVCVINDKNIEVMLYPYRIDENHIMVNMKDISRDKLIQEQSRLISMGEMVGNIAHQWRQPLSIITSIASSIKVLNNLKKIESEDLDKNMQKIMEQSNYLSDTIDDFRNFIVNTSDLENLSIIKTLKKSLSLLDSAIKMNKIRVITDFRDDLIISGFQNELIQSFINILNNSKDAIIENVVNTKDRLILICSKKIDEGVKVEIKDSGGGIEEDILDRIFEPYFTTKHQNFGTGIGLAMTHKFITQRHKASIKANNINFSFKEKEYKGASFVIIFEDNLKPKDFKES